MFGNEVMLRAEMVKTAIFLAPRARPEVELGECKIKINSSEESEGARCLCAWEMSVNTTRRLLEEERKPKA